MREHDLTGRFALGTPRDELTELADNHRMLDRITQAILTERRLTDENGMELRTAVRDPHRGAARPAGAGPGAVPAASRTAILAATDRMTSFIGANVAVARGTRRRAALPAPRGAGPRPEHAPSRSGVDLEVADAGDERPSRRRCRWWSRR